MPNINDSILDSVKNTLGIYPEDNSFDAELMLHINTVLSNVVQMGVGPKTGFSITGNSELWSSFITEPDKLTKLSNVKTYVALKVKLIFDTPASSVVKEALEGQCKELEYRMYTECGGY